MAGDWIPVQKRTVGKSEVGKLMTITGRSRHEVIGLMVHFWIWAEDETIDGTIHTPLSTLVTFIGGDIAFWQAVADVGWLEIPDSNTIVVPRADHWLTSGAKARLLKNKRQAKWRVDAPASTRSSTREEKRTRSLSCSPSSSTKRNRSVERSTGVRGLLRPPFDVVTRETLSDVAKLRQWFLASAAAISLSEGQPGWECCCAAALHAIAEGRKPPQYLFQKLLKDAKGRNAIGGIYLARGRHLAKGAA